MFVISLLRPGKDNTLFYFWERESQAGNSRQSHSVTTMLLPRH